MFKMSRGDPEYARDFYDYLVDCGLLLIDSNKAMFHAVNAIDLSRPNECKGSVLPVSTRFEAMEIDIYNSFPKFVSLYAEEDSSSYPYYSPRNANSSTSRDIVSQSNSKSYQLVSLEHHMPLQTLELVSLTNHTL